MNIRAKASTTFTSREFNQDTARAKRAAKDGPVFITTRGEPSYVLLTKQEYDRLKRAETPPKKEFKSLAEALADNRPEADFDFKIPEFKGVFKGFEFD
ncbi:type II toxin-antitoxin system prevent-host-death family antitoxin [Mesorhizobium sp. LHD-90]|uniref:type II toxin-antitoxin system prevent-host-death family antitoxin n=1 Tax=Mesorhizobium sp. LHD-90 TaxID=3071414 RepID=UPI0027E19735|nr:type II toxin-antitoxin system prevent-host-death family antitoxin [Mesorhizobium sp. LHD-90]MDQ6436745.1 type II toxin-antitoxin system prevent-host-death family antitoxin [Mesorhizobium sp. LHD-90]